MNKNIINKIANEILSIKVMTLEELFDNPISKIAISLGELIFRTSKRSIKYAKGCVATSKKNDPKNGRWSFRVKCNQKWSKGPYDVNFKLLKNKGPKTVGILGREIQVSCNCNAWKYNGADSNALNQDYSERQYSNGQAPTTRDPRRKYLICKHIAAAVPLFKRFLIPKEFTEPEKLLQKKPIVPVKPKTQKPKQEQIVNKNVEPKVFQRKPTTQPKTIKKLPKLPNVPNKNKNLDNNNLNIGE